MLPDVGKAFTKSRVLARQTLDVADRLCPVVAEKRLEIAAADFGALPVRLAASCSKPDDLERLMRIGQSSCCARLS